MTEEMLHYARSDTHYLLYCYDRLKVPHFLVLSVVLLACLLLLNFSGWTLRQIFAGCACCQVL